MKLQKISDFNFQKMKIEETLLSKLKEVLIVLIGRSQLIKVAQMKDLLPMGRTVMKFTDVQLFTND